MNGTTFFTTDEIKQAIHKFWCDTTRLFIVNNEDLSELDLSQISKYVFMIPVAAIERGTLYEITGADFKLELFEICTKNKSIYRGKRED